MKSAELRQFIAILAAFTLVSGSVLAHDDDSPPPRVRVTAAHTQTSGMLLAVDPQNVTILPDRQRDPVRIPFASISTAEVSDGKRSRPAATLGGIGVGVVVGIGASVVAAKNTSHTGSGAFCDSCLWNGLAAGLTFGIASGAVTVILIRRERWRRVPPSSLESLAP